MSEKPEVDGKDLLQRGLDAMFNRLGDAIHGATKKETGKAKGSEAAPQGDAKTVIETEGSESGTASPSEAPPQEKRA